MSNDQRYDVVVIGAGHNGLVCANYLARAGLNVFPSLPTSLRHQQPLEFL